MSNCYPTVFPIVTKTFVKIKAIMGCACSKSLYEYSMDSSMEDLIKSYEQTQRDSGIAISFLRNWRA